MEERGWRFGPFRWEPKAARLWRGDETVTLQPKPLAVLCYLVEHPGQLIDKDQLLDAVWGHQFLSEGVLKSCIAELRKALGDDPKAARYIETVSRRGYRFIGQVSAADASVLPAVKYTQAGDWVGREELLRRLREQWETARGGERRLVFLIGEAGLGKTTLIEMFLHALVGDRPAVLWGQCIEHFGAGEAFLPLLGALQQFGPGAAAALRAVAPAWLLQLPGLSSAEERKDLQKEALGTTRERMLREGCELLELLTADTPLIVILEDLHWSDYATLDLLAVLGRRRGRAALLVLGSYRPSDVALQDHPLSRVRWELQTHRLCAELPLDAFSWEELGAYLALRFPEGLFPEDISRAILQRTGGHPLFVVNLIDYLLAEGKLRQSGEEWCLAGGIDSLMHGVPDDIRHLIEHQIARLGAGEQRLLEAAGVAGMESSAALLAAVLDREPIAVEADCETLARHGPMLAAAGVAEWPDGTVAGRYAFRHALYGEVLYQRLPPAYRISLHRRLGERLECGFEDRTDEVAAELARHFEEGREWSKALGYLVRAAELALASFANREALGYLERALMLTGRLPAVQRTQMRFALLQGTAAVRCSMYAMEGAINDFFTLLHDARAAGDKLWEVRALVDLSRMYYLVDPKRCLDLVSAALEQSRALTDEQEKTLVRGYHAHWQLTFVGWRDEYAEACREAFAEALLTNEPRIVSRYLIARIVCEWYLSNYRTAAAEALDGMQWSERAGDGYLYMVCQSLRCMALVAGGDWGNALEQIGAGIAAAEKNGNLMQLRRFRLTTVWLYLEAGDLEAARRGGEDASAMAVQGDSITSNLCQILLAKIYLGLGDHPRAHHCLQEVTRRQEQDGMILDGFCSLFFPWVYGEYCLLTGGLPQARQQADRLCLIASTRPERTFLALGYRLLAQIALAEGGFGEAETHLAQALSVIEGGPFPLAAVRVYETGAELYERLGRETEMFDYRARTAGVVRTLTESLNGSSEDRDRLRALLRARAG